MINLSLLEERQALPLPDEYKDLAGKKLLVTGAAGFIGGALFKRLVEYDLDVIGTVLYEEEAATLREQGYRAEVLDLASDVSWDDLLKGIDIVFNIAALFQEVENTEAMYRKVNVDGTLKLIKTAEKAGVERSPVPRKHLSTRWMNTTEPSWKASWQCSTMHAHSVTMA
jgi:FlaA1/EpsC-like NDP-sugar epimerase